MAGLIEAAIYAGGMAAFMVVVSLLIFGVHALFMEGMIFGKFGGFIRSGVGDFWAKPLIDCPPCMSSFWGTLGFGIGANWGVFDFLTPLQILTMWPVFIVVLAGLLSILSGIAFGCEQCEECHEDHFDEHLL